MVRKEPAVRSTEGLDFWSHSRGTVGEQFQLIGTSHNMTQLVLTALEAKCAARRTLSLYT